ncbi:serine hydrolase-domain-containing protein [Epithele typhae]|uniref:serine hydrolase-domain-containing protein n=1 Tax=Epithele typhae TaxID=378194 RepID=UPI002007E568|nr:serine hydrolase-domain-containing protein [Epithele typhae]KAH9940039.1 serine hydrolase-domain-containing protein [Epithele typhae]
MNAPKKILMLHGYAQNANIFSKRMGALRKSCGKDIDFVFMNGPHTLTPADLAATFGASADESSLDALGTAGASTESDPSLAPRGWWMTDRSKTQTIGLEESILAIRDVLFKDRYDGIFGFSVFCVAAAGFRPSSPLCDTILLPNFSTPTLHIVGHTDVIVIPERAQKLIDINLNSRIEYHDGGHFIPSKANWRNFLKAYLKDPLGNVPPPSPHGPGGSQPTSGTATPSTPVA